MPATLFLTVGLPGTGPGTSDLPVNTDVAWAEYAVVEITGPQMHAVTFHRIPVDFPAVISAAYASRWGAYAPSGKEDGPALRCSLASSCPPRLSSPCRRSRAGTGTPAPTSLSLSRPP